MRIKGVTLRIKGVYFNHGFKFWNPLGDTTMKALLIEKLNKLASDNSDLVIYDTGAEMAAATDEQIDVWLIDVGSNRDEIRVEATIQEFVDAAIDAINGDFSDFNAILGYSKDNKWDTEDYSDIISKFERITDLEL